MSIRSLRYEPLSFEHHDVDIHDAGAPEARQDCNGSKGDPRQILLRDDHLVLLAIDGLLALSAWFKRWRAR